jgi:hypothetical protein
MASRTRVDRLHAAREQSFSSRAPLNTAKREAALRRDRLLRLLNHAVELHGIQAVGLLLVSLEHDVGDIGIDRRLAALADADPAALRLIEADAR